MTNMPRQGNLWIDLTDMYNWQGYFTGIQNVVDNYTQLYIAEGSPAVRFFVYHPATRQYEEIAAADWQVRRQHILQGSTPTRAAAVEQPSLSFRARRKAVHIAKRATPKVLKDMVRAQREAYRQDVVYGAPGSHPFQKGDTVLIIGGNWGDDYRGYAEGLARIKKTTGIRLVHVIHDLIPIRYPNYFAPGASFERYFGHIAKAADGFLCVSQSSQADLEYFLGGKTIASAVFRLGEDFPNITPKKPGLPLEKQFILCVGTIEPRKNHALLYNAVKLARQKGIAVPQLVIVGRQGWMAEQVTRNLTADPDLKGKVIVSHTISDEEKAWLFRHCLFTIYPSYYEGWGLPVVESLHNGKLCLSSNMSSLPEAGDKYAEYFSPYAADELLKLIQKYTDPAKLKAKAELIARRPSYTWEESFASFKQQLAKILK